MSLTYRIQAVVPLDKEIKDLISTYFYLLHNSIEIPEVILEKVKRYNITGKCTVGVNYITIDIDKIYKHEELGIPLSDYEGTCCVIDFEKVPKNTKYLIATCS